MFGLGKKKQGKIVELERRLAALARDVAHNDRQIKELASAVMSLENLGGKISELQTRQAILRTGLSDVVDKL